MWIIVGIIAGLLIVGGVAVVNAVTDQAEEVDCENCDNSCSLERNCGKVSCGAVTGGSCGCRG